MKKLLSLLLTVAMIACAATCLGESTASVLTPDELDLFVQQIIDYAKTQPLRNEGGTASFDQQDGYALVYDFGILYCSKPELDDDTRINEIVITSPDFQSIRGVNVDAPLSQLLDAYYTENDSLSGDKYFAGLYAGDFLPEYAVWAWVQRDGQNVGSVQYAVHDAQSSGGEGYTDMGILYTIQDMFVSAIRIYGISASVSKAEVESNLQTVGDLMKISDYSRVASGRMGDQLLPFGRQDLIFENVDFFTLTPDKAVDAFGDTLDDQWIDDGENGFIRVMDFPACSLTFTTDTSKANPQIYMVYISEKTMEGPRGVTIGDYLADVIDRFPSGQGEFDGTSEVLYGDIASDTWATAEYSQDGTASTYYSCTIGGKPVTLYISFSMMQADEIMVIFG